MTGSKAVSSPGTPHRPPFDAEAPLRAEVELSRSSIELSAKPGSGRSCGAGGASARPGVAGAGGARPCGFVEAALRGKADPRGGTAAARPAAPHVHHHAPT